MLEYVPVISSGLREDMTVSECQQLLSQELTGVHGDTHTL